MSNSPIPYVNRFGIVAQLEANGTTFPARGIINITGGATLVDDAANNQTILDLTGAIASVKLYGTVDPTGVTDCSAAFQAAVNALAGTGVALLIPDGTYNFHSSCVIPSGKPLTIIAGPKVIIKSTMAFTGLQTNTPFYAKAATTGKTGTLTSTPVAGAQTISWTVVTGAAPAVGEILVVSHGNSAQVMTIRGVSGVGPYVVTLDQPLAFPFVIGDPLSTNTSRPTVRIFGNGMTFTGTGDRAIEIVTGYQCWIEDVHYDAMGVTGISDIAFSYDIGGEECVFSHCSADGANTASFYGFALESCLRSHIVDCTVSRSSAIGFAILDGLGCTMRGCNYYGTGDATGGAFAMGTDAALGSVGCAIIGCTSNGGTYGCVLNGSSRCSVSDSTFQYAGTAGVLFNSATNFGTRFSNVSVYGSATGFNMQAGNKGTEIRGLNAGACTTACLIAADEITVDGLECKGIANAINAIQLTGTATQRISNLTLETSANANAINFAGIKCFITKARITLSGLAIGFYVPSGNGALIVSESQISGAGTAADVTNGTIRIGNGCDFGGLAVTLHAGAFSSRKGTLVANGVTGVAVAFPDIKASDVLHFTLQTIGGTVGHPKYTIIAGTGFTFTSDAADTSTYEWWIP